MLFLCSWYKLQPIEPVENSDKDPLSTIDAQILFDRLLQPILRIDSYQTENRMIYGTLSLIFILMMSIFSYALLNCGARLFCS